MVVEMLYGTFGRYKVSWMSVGLDCGIIVGVNLLLLALRISKSKIKEIRAPLMYMDAFRSGIPNL